MDTLEFFEAHREIELNVTRCIGIVCQVKVVVEAIVFSAKAQRLMPLHSFFFPEFIPLHFFAWLDEELHFHLFKFTHAEYKLARNDFISECFSNLGDTKRNFHSSRFLNVQEVDKN